MCARVVERFAAKLHKPQMISNIVTCICKLHFESVGVTIRRLPGNLQAVVSMLMCFSLERESGPKPSELQMKHSQGIKHVALQCSIACTIPLALITRNYFLHNFATTLQPSARRLHHRPT